MSLLRYTSPQGHHYGDITLSDTEGRWYGLPIVVQFLDGERWILQSALSYRHGKRWIRVPKGYVTDFANIPRIAFLLIGQPTGFAHGGEYGPAAIIHDYLCETATTAAERIQADHVFFEAMLYSKVDKWRARTMFWAVRLYTWALMHL